PAGGPDHRMTGIARSFCATAVGRVQPRPMLLPQGSRNSVISRRTFVATLTGSVLTGPLAAGAQPGGVRRIGWLGGPSRDTAQPFVQPFLQGMKDLGWVEGQNLVIEWRFAGGRAERLPDLATELVRLRVELIVVPSTPTAMAAKNATTTIPYSPSEAMTPSGWGPPPAWRGREETSRG